MAGAPLPKITSWDTSLMESGMASSPKMAPSTASTQPPSQSSSPSESTPRGTPLFQVPADLAELHTKFHPPQLRSRQSSMESADPWLESTFLEEMAQPSVARQRSGLQTPLQSPFSTPQTSPPVAMATPRPMMSPLSLPLEAMEFDSHDSLPSRSESRKRASSAIPSALSPSALFTPKVGYGKSSFSCRPAVLVCALFTFTVASMLLLYLQPTEAHGAFEDGQGKNGFRGLTATVQMAIHREVSVVVEDSLGGFGFSQEVLFGDWDGRDIYKGYTQDDHDFMRSLKNVIKTKTDARNVFIAKSDSLFQVEEEVARLSITLSGAVSAEYVAVAFNGAGFLDRRGKDGGHKNWSIRGFFRPGTMKKKYVEFLDAATAEAEMVEDSCSATVSS